MKNRDEQTNEILKLKILEMEKDNAMLREKMALMKVTQGIDADSEKYDKTPKGNGDQTNMTVTAQLPNNIFASNVPVGEINQPSLNSEKPES